MTISSIEHSEWAVRCGCGEILPQMSEEAARVTVTVWNSREVSRRHGTASLAYRRVLVTDWEDAHEPAPV